EEVAGSGGIAGNLLEVAPLRIAGPAERGPASEVEAPRNGVLSDARERVPEDAADDLRSRFVHAELARGRGLKSEPAGAARRHWLLCECRPLGRPPGPAALRLCVR